MESAEEERIARLIAEHSKALPRVFGDTSQHKIVNVDPRLSEESTGHIYAYALGYLQELAARVREHNSNPEAEADAKIDACRLLVNIASYASELVHICAHLYPTETRAIAETRDSFPCLMPAHAEEREEAISELLHVYDLGKRHRLKLRGKNGRKTFSTTTFINSLLRQYIALIRQRARASFEQRIVQATIGESTNEMSDEERLTYDVPLNIGNAKQWNNAIWKLLIRDCPNPERHKELSRLGTRASRVDRASLGGTSTKLQDLLEAEVSELSPAQISIVRNSIKEALLKHLRRIVRAEAAAANTK